MTRREAGETLPPPSLHPRFRQGNMNPAAGRGPAVAQLDLLRTSSSGSRQWGNPAGALLLGHPLHSGKTNSSLPEEPDLGQLEGRSRPGSALPLKQGRVHGDAGDNTLITVTEGRNGGDASAGGETEPRCCRRELWAAKGRAVLIHCHPKGKKALGPRGAPGEGSRTPSSPFQQYPAQAEEGGAAFTFQREIQL